MSANANLHKAKDAKNDEFKVTNGGAINCVLAIEQDTVPVGTVYYTSGNSQSPMTKVTGLPQ